MHRPRSVFCVMLLLGGAVALGSPIAGAEVPKPAYAAGDRWIYDLRASLDAFPGLNASEVGTFTFGLLGRVDVAIAGPDQAIVDGGPIPAVRVDTRASGFLNGTFSAPGLPCVVSVTGSFTSDTSELWEMQAYLPIASNATTTYLATFSCFVTIDLTANVGLNAMTAYASIPPFDLGVGNTSTTSVTTTVLANTTVSGFGPTMYSENVTTVTGNWTRHVLASTNVTVDAGTFPAVEVNQTLTSFAGLAGIVPAQGANETAYFSSKVGNYVKRDAYANGTRVAEMTLQSYSYGAGSAGLSLVEITLLAGVPTAVFLLVVFLYRRRKRKATVPPEAGPDAR